MLAPLRERHAGAAGMIANLQEHNRRVKAGEATTQEAIAQARAETRRDTKAASVGAILRSTAEAAEPQPENTNPTNIETW